MRLFILVFAVGLRKMDNAHFQFNPLWREKFFLKMEWNNK